VKKNEEDITIKEDAKALEATRLLIERQQREFEKTQEKEFEADYIKRRYKRFADAKKVCATVTKRGENAFHKYSYVTEADVVSAVNEACFQYDLFWNCTFNDFKSEIIRTPTKDGESIKYRSTCTCYAIVCDAISGNMIQASTGLGESLDTGDKAIFKAQTGAKKYALMALFGVASYNDPESESPLVNPEVGARLRGEKIKYIYIIPKEAADADAALQKYLLGFKTKISWLPDLAAKIILNAPDMKLERFFEKTEI
jgi:hypothetical protein